MRFKVESQRSRAAQSLGSSTELPLRGRRPLPTRLSEVAEHPSLAPRLGQLFRPLRRSPPHQSSLALRSVRADGRSHYGAAVTIDIGRIGIWSAAFEAQPSFRAQEAAQELEAMGYPVLWINEATGRDRFVWRRYAVGDLDAEVGDGHRQRLARETP